jgi:peptidoglycan/xylan/chitin deacetylase (PgdA/CDA1 family)
MISVRKQMIAIFISIALIAVCSVDMQVYAGEAASTTNVIIQDDFSNETNMWSYGGSAFRQEESEYIILTKNTDFQKGEIWLNEEIMPPFSVEFRYKIGGGSGGGCLTLLLEGKAEDPDIHGSGIEFDSDQDEWDNSGNHIAYISDYGRIHVKMVDDLRTKDDIWHEAKVIVLNNRLEVSIDDEKVLTYKTNDELFSGKLGFVASTDHLNNWQMIDYVKVTQLKNLVTIFNKRNGEAISVLQEEASEYHEYVGENDVVTIYDIFAGRQSECLGNEIAVKLAGDDTGKWVVAEEAVAFPFESNALERTFENKIELYGTAVKVPVLMYHHILKAEDKKATNNLIVTVEEFEEQMEYLYSNDYTTITTEELELFIDNKLELPKNSVLITFDDGYKSNYLYAYPILKKYGYKASIALIPKLMPEALEAFNPTRLNYLSWQEVILGRDIFEYTNHTYSHISMKNISYQNALEEIKKAGDILQSKYFVYPIGHTSASSEKVLKELNYKLAFTTTSGFVTKSSNKLFLRRQRINAGITLRTFKALLG